MTVVNDLWLLGRQHPGVLGQFLNYGADFGLAGSQPLNGPNLGKSWSASITGCFFIASLSGQVSHQLGDCHVSATLRAEVVGVHGYRHQESNAKGHHCPEPMCPASSLPAGHLVRASESFGSSGTHHIHAALTLEGIGHASLVL